MRLVIVTGLSGSGKSIALNTLEDNGYYCIDNLPLALLEPFSAQLAQEGKPDEIEAAVGIDVRNRTENLATFPEVLERLSGLGIDVDILFLRADETTLLRRYSETRRKHPLSGEDNTLAEAIRHEKELLDPLLDHANLHIDTSRSNVHQLRDMVRDRVARGDPATVSILFQSFGYKNGVPPDADYVFDVRCLPNPYWQTQLRPLTGMDPEVSGFLGNEPMVKQMLDSLTGFLDCWIPRFTEMNRGYLSVAIGCTGGQHRSVYLVEKLVEYFSPLHDNVLKSHRELP